jgi:hypothetical protein
MEVYAARKLHRRTLFQGLKISVENRKGSVRRGTDDGGHKWATTMHNDYGYIRNTTGRDKQHIDCFLGPNLGARNVYVVHTNRPPDFQSYDEDKVFLGFQSAAAAKACFLQHYDSPKFFRGMDTLTMDEFKKRFLHGKSKSEMLDGKKLAANVGEPQIYDGGMAHIQPIQIYHAPSLKKTKPVPVDDPMEKDNEFLDVTKRRDRETIGFRDRLSKRKGSDEKYIGIRTTQVSGFPSVSVGGFG